jgi:hypothetical protein
MTGRKQQGRAVPPDAPASTPFFARFLEDQHGGDAAAKAAASFQTLKYPSDRDEDDVYSRVHVEAAPTRAVASSRSLKYPSDRDEIDD